MCLVNSLMCAEHIEERFMFQVQIFKLKFNAQVKEYELSEVFHHNEESLANEILKMEHISYIYEEGEGNTLVLKKNASASTTTTTTTTTTTAPTTVGMSTTTADPEPAAQNVCKFATN